MPFAMPQRSSGPLAQLAGVLGALAANGRQSSAACLSTLRSPALLLVAACPHSPKPPQGCTHARLSCALWGKPCPAPVATRYSWRQQRTWCSLQGTTTLQGTASRFSPHQHNQESLSFMYCTGTPYPSTRREPLQQPHKSFCQREALTPYKGSRDPCALWLDKARVAPASPRSWPRAVVADRLLVLQVYPYYSHTARRIQTYRNTCCPTNRRSQRSKVKGSEK
jgi:hypothetical protein